MDNNCLNKNICIELELNTPHIEIELEMGAKGKDGKDATINGVNTLNVVAGNNISLEQEGSTLTITGTYEYDDTGIKNDINEINEELKNYALKEDVPTKLSQLENDSNYVRNTDYATSTVAGVIKSNAGLDVEENGMVVADTYNYDEYEAKTDNNFISKGTLENVITGKNLETANNKVTSLGTGSTDIEYPSAKCTYKIKEDLDNLKSDILETGTASDSFINVQDSAMAELQELSIDGLCEQETTSGKNLLENTLLTTATTLNGVNATPNSGGSITLNGTATANCYFNIAKIDFGTKSFNNYNKFSDDYKASTGSTQEIPSLVYDSSNKYTYINVPRGTSLNNFVVKPMVRLASITDDTYEPYTGGQPSPSPDYPQEIKTITDSLSVTSCNDNIFNSYSLKNAEPRFITNIEFDGTIIIENVTTSNGYCDTNRTLKQLCPSLKVGDTIYFYCITDFIENNVLKSRIYLSKSKYSINNTYNTRVITQDDLDSNVIVYGGYNTTSHVKINISYRNVKSYQTHLQSQITANLPEGEFIGKINDTYKDTLKVEYNKDDGQYHLKLYKRVYKNNSYNGESYNYYISTTARKDGNIECGELQTGQAVYYDGDETKIDLGVVDMPLSYNEVTNIFTDSDLLPQINAKYYKNFITTIRNLQVNNDTLKNELVSIENRLAELEKAKENVTNNEEVSI